MSAQSLLELLPSPSILTAETPPRSEQNQEDLRGRRLELMGYLARLPRKALSGWSHCFARHHLSEAHGLSQEAVTSR